MRPGNHESADKRTGGKTRKGSTWLRRALTEAAQGAARTKRVGRTALAQLYRQLVARRGKQKAAVAVGHRILPCASHPLQPQEAYRELAPADSAARRLVQLRTRAVQPLRQRGFEITPTHKAVAGADIFNRVKTRSCRESTQGHRIPP